MKTTEFIVENSVIAQEADVMHADHEVQMARSQMYSAAQAAIEIHRLLKNISEMQGIEGWVASKLTLASEYLESVRDYLKYEQVSKEPKMMKFAEDAANYAVNQLLVEDDYDDAVKDYFSRGGKVEKLPAKKPRKSEKTDFSSRHISGKGEVGRGKAGRIGKAAKTDPKGKPVVATEQTPNLAGTGYQQGTSIVKTAPGQIQQDIGTSNAIGGTLQNIDSLRQGGPNMMRNTAPAVNNMIGGMKTAQTDVNKKLAIAGVGQTPTAPQQPAPKTDLSQYKDDDMSEAKRFKKLREMATGGGSSAGGIATSMSAPAGKPGTGKPKKIANAHKTKKIAVGKGVY